MVFNVPLKIGFAGETKTGKSYLAASFIKEFDGVFLDFAAVQQITDRKSAPAYDVSRLAKGEAFRAVKTVGINTETQYKFIKNWADLENAIEYARMYRDDVSTKANKRIWLVCDDSAMWRWHAAMHATKAAGNKVITKNDWGMGTTMMTLMVRRLEAEFNLLIVNQMQDLYENGENTGKRAGRYYPSGIEYALDVVGELYIDRTKRPYSQHFKVLANRASFVCLDSYIEDIVNPDPRRLLEALCIEVDLW